MVHNPAIGPGPTGEITKKSTFLIPHESPYAISPEYPLMPLLEACLCSLQDRENYQPIQVICGKKVNPLITSWYPELTVIDDEFIAHRVRRLAHISYAYELMTQSLTHDLIGQTLIDHSFEWAPYAPSFPTQIPLVKSTENPRDLDLSQPWELRTLTREAFHGFVYNEDTYHAWIPHCVAYADPRVHRIRTLTPDSWVEISTSNKGRQAHIADLITSTFEAELERCRARYTPKLSEHPLEVDADLDILCSLFRAAYLPGRNLERLETLSSWYNERTGADTPCPLEVAQTHTTRAYLVEQFIQRYPRVMRDIAIAIQQLAIAESHYTDKELHLI